MTIDVEALQALEGEEVALSGSCTFTCGVSCGHTGAAE